MYGLGANLKEEFFDPEKYEFTDSVSSKENYAKAKRQCEALFSQSSLGSVLTIVRFPIVVGPDDYTGRLQFHIQRIRDQEPIYFPNREAKISLICSEDAANTLLFLGAHADKPFGPLNSAVAEPIALKSMVSAIEVVLGKSAIYSDHEEGSNYSPYGIKSDWWMNVDRIKHSGFASDPRLERIIEESVFVKT